MAIRHVPASIGGPPQGRRSGRLFPTPFFAKTHEKTVARFLKNREATRGQAPGDLVFVGDKKMDRIAVHVIDYTDDHLVERSLDDIREAEAFRDSESVTWINVNGLHDSEPIRSIGTAYGLHPLVLDDIVNTGQRPKLDEYDDYLFVVAKMMRYDEAKGEVHSEQISMVIGRNFLITFQERPGDVFEPVRERIRKQKGRIRRVGADYLAYALLDTIVDNYAFIVERLGEQIEDIEDEILEEPTQEVLSKINDYKREMNYLRKSVRPAREFIMHLARLETELIHDDTEPFLKDLLDLASQTIEVVDAYRDMLSDHLNIYNTGVSNRLNETMKVLTMFSAFFIPLTFIVGIYGTNFDNVPELHYRYSYYIMWVVFAIVSFTMLRFFRKRNWL